MDLKMRYSTWRPSRSWGACELCSHLISWHMVQFLDPGPTHWLHKASQSSHTPSSDT